MVRLSIALLGRFEVTAESRPVTGFRSDKVRLLLAYLVMEADRAHRRDALAGLFWPGYAQSSALNSLRTALANLRQILAPAGRPGEAGAETPFLLITPDTVQFNRRLGGAASDYALDVALLQTLPPDHLSQVPSDALRRSADSYRGEFLEGYALADSPTLEEWLTWQREYYRRRAGEALQQLSERALADGDYAQAERDARRLLQLDPWNEGAHRQVMSALALGGQRGAALAQYEACVRALAEGPGVEPEPETTALRNDIRDGRLRAATPPGARPAEPPRSLDSQPSEAFVGRHNELSLLSEKLEQARASRGSLVLLAGEAGIGKTTVARQLAGHAQGHGSTVLWGRCFEGEWQPPFGPWVEVLDEVARTTDPALLRRQLGATAPTLAQLVPEIRAALPDLPEAPLLGPDAGRFRLYDAVFRFLAQAAQRAPLVLILDDLHWADRDSLQLLRYVARSVQRTRILLLAIYRDPETGVTAQHPLVQTLAMLRREIDYQQLSLHGLEYDELTEYLAEAAGQTLPQALVKAVYAETNGNPFYTHEVWRHLTEESKILRRAGRWSTDSSIGDLGIPDGVRQVVGRRMTRLGQETNALLRVASGLSGEFGLEVLQSLVDLPEDKLLDCLDEALQGGLLRVVGTTPPRYDFRHAIVRHTVYETLNPDRRRRLHRRIAEALERAYAGHEQDHAAELAAQYYASLGLSGAERGMPYAMAAAKQARDSYAHTRAVSLLRQARDLAPQDQPALRADILCKLALAEADALLLDEARRSVDEALAALSAAAVQPRAQAEFLSDAARALKDAGAKTMSWEPLLERGLALLGEAPHDLLWARLMLLRNRYRHIMSGPLHAGYWLGLDAEAVGIARASGDEEAYARTLVPIEWRTRQETEAVLAIARTWVQPPAIMRALDVVGRDLIYRHGSFPEGGAIYRELLALAERYGSIPAQAEALAQVAIAQWAMGDLPAVRVNTGRILEMVTQLGTQHRLRVFLQIMPFLVGYFFTADWPPLAAKFSLMATDSDTAQIPVGLIPAGYAIHAHVRAGNEIEARRLLAALVPILETVDPTMYLHNVAVHLLSMSVWDLGAAEYASTCTRLLGGVVDAGLGSVGWGPHELMLARMAALGGQMDKAISYLAQARAWAETRQHRYVAPIIDYDEALALVRAGSLDRLRIDALLDKALGAFRTLEMSDWRQCTLALQEKLAASPAAPTSGPAYPDGLTAREVEVLRLLAEGLTNKEIAERLVVSISTVSRHIATIYNKIDARNRAQAAAFALRHGLLSARGPT